MVLNRSFRSILNAHKEECYSERAARAGKTVLETEDLSHKAPKDGLKSCSLTKIIQSSCIDLNSSIIIDHAKTDSCTDN